MEMNFIKCHGSGNDFLLLDEYTKPLEMNDEERSLMAKVLCDRSSGIGADGILFFQKSDVADGKMRVFNADGSEASMCGNGLRCVVRYASEQLLLNEMKIETMKAVLACELTEEIHEGIKTYKVEISPVLFHVDALPMKIEAATFIDQKLPDIAGELSFTAVAVPNPHLISIVDKSMLKGHIQEKLSTYLNGKNPYFPDGVNVSFVYPFGEGEIFVRTFERGVGFTNACGTAMSASTLVACMQGIAGFETPVTVYNPGGKVRCVAHKQNETYYINLIGNGTFDGEYTVEWEDGAYRIIGMEKRTDETNAYEEMKKDVEQYLHHKL
ncbi:MAG: diaminopimelate epimerase [Bacillus sp. (in: firmicutes)]